MDSRPFIVVLNATNPSRLGHLRKLFHLRHHYRFFLVCDKRSDISWQKAFIPDACATDMLDLDADFSDLVASIDGRGKLSGILNLSEFAVPLQAKLCAYYGLPGPSANAAQIGRNKAEMRTFLKNLGMPVPKFSRISSEHLSVIDGFQFPVIIKPATGGGSTLVRRCETKEEVIKTVYEFETKAIQSYGRVSLSKERSEPLVVEEVIGGEVLFPTALPFSVGEISVESIHVRGKTTVLAIHDKPLPSNGPYFEEYLWSTPSRIPQGLSELALDYVDRIHRSLGAYVLHTEFRTLPRGLVPLEFGVRMGGACIYQTLLHSTGIDFLEVLLDLCQGRTPKLSQGPAVPTIAHALWVDREGTISKIAGEVELTRSPLYVEHQLYDDIGAHAKRAPLSSRGSGHVIYRSVEGFGSIERELSDRLRHFRLEVEGSVPSFSQRRYTA